MPKLKREKFYMIISNKNNYTYGAFPYTKEGKSNKNLQLKIKIK
jgi:hypothetical protein